MAHRQAIQAEDHAEIWRLASEQPRLLSETDSDGWSAVHWAALQLAHAQARNSGSENERLRQELHRERAENARLTQELQRLMQQQQLAGRALDQEKEPLRQPAPGDEG